MSAAATTMDIEAICECIDPSTGSLRKSVLSTHPKWLVDIDITSLRSIAVKVIFAHLFVSLRSFLLAKAIPVELQGVRTSESNTPSLQNKQHLHC